MGKPKYIETPGRLWELFKAYKKEVKDNPRLKVEYVGKNGDRVQTPLERPLSIDGFKTFCHYEASDINRYWYNVDDDCKEYVSIVTRIKGEIRAEQIDGGMMGSYNSNLTARLNNLKEQSETTSTMNVKMLNIDPLDDSED